MFPICRFPSAVVSLLLAGCLTTRAWRDPTADELHELSLEELLEIPIETVRGESGALQGAETPPVAVVLPRVTAPKCEAKGE